MLKAALVGVVALTTIGTSSVWADDMGDVGRPSRSAVQSGMMLTHAQIARFKSVLKLTALQEQYWPAVEQAFREMGRQHSSDETSRGFIQGISNRAVAVAVSAVALQRLASAAYPLIRSLDDGQKQSALALARSMGLESVASAF
ncbi:MAG: hypothetical protein QOJ96_3203 [Alphaproteobacteria bacterium]|nr:hypothetical protein [Alphaproteobacteria bacterium]